MTDKLMLIDGNSLMNRAFYALPVLSTKSGQITNAVYGFLAMFYNAYEQYKPTHIMVAFDRREPTFRHKEYDVYKAGRKSMPEELVPQFPLIREVLEKINIPACDLAGYEADDIIGTFARISDEAGGECIILSGDKDVLQLISNKTTVWITKRGISEVEKFDEAHLMEVYQLIPDQIKDLKGLMGDSSDNIPGIPGVGEKTALKLISEYGSVENVLNNATDIKGKLSEKIQNGKDSAIMSKHLATIDKYVPLTKCDMNCCLYTPAPASVLIPLFTELEFKSLLSKINKQQNKVVEEISQYAQAQQSIIKDNQELTILLKELQKADKIAIYLDISSKDQSSISFSIDGDTNYKILLCQNMIQEGIPYDNALKLLGELCQNSAIQKVAYHSKHLMHIIADDGFSLNGHIDDVMIAEYLLDSLSTDYSLNTLINKYQVNAQGAAAIWRIWQKQSVQLLSGGVQEVYKTIEMPLINVLFDMEQTGFYIDAQVLRQLGAQYTEKINMLTTQIYTQVGGETFNINSPKQLGEVLFERLGLPYGRKTKTGYSTDIDVLENLRDQHEIIPLLIEYRQAQKFRSTYIEGMLNLIDKDNRIHTTFNQTVAATGRISSTEPNLQNIPVRTEYGRNIRKAFVARNDNWVLIDGDYSQIELRILAHLSGDPVMIDTFKKQLDIHTSTASEVFNVPLNEVTKEQRSAAKAVNFGIIYGISDFGLSQNIGITRKQANEYIAGYFAHYPKVKAFMDSSITQAKTTGFSTTMLGRRRPMPELTSSNYNIRSFGERVAMNTPVQGTAADIIKLAMIKVDQALKDNNLEAKLILQVHDELLIEAPKHEANQAQKIMEDCMSEVLKLDVPLGVDIKQGKSWYDTK